MREKLMGFARLARPANLPTAAADIVAGAALGYYFGGTQIVGTLLDAPMRLVALIFSSVFLYAGGVVFNDVFDAKLDAVERPERAIPSGLVSIGQAKIWGFSLFLFGLVLAFSVDVLSGNISLLLVLAILTYDAFLKKSSFFGPLSMGVCRGLNLLLGISIVGALPVLWIIIIPVIYIFAITLISRGEVHGDNKTNIIWAGLLYIIVIVLIVLAIARYANNIMSSIPFLAVFTFLVFRPLLKAYRVNSPEHVKKAVISGVLSLILMDAVWVAGFSNWYTALPVVLLLPLSMLLSKIFAVT